MPHLKINLIFTPGADLKDFPSIFKNALLTTFEEPENANDPSVPTLYQEQKA